MANQSKPAWYGVVAVVIGTGIFFLAANKGRLFKKGKARVKALLGSPPAAPAAEATPGLSRFEGRTPTPQNGHVRDVVATHLPPPETGSNFSRHGDVHGPTGEAGK